MIRLTLRGMAARRTRTVLTGLAIVLGVAMISGALTVSDTMRRAADSLSSSAYRGTDAVVDARTAFTVSAARDSASPPTVPAGLLARVRAVPQVAVAAGDVTDTQTRLIDTHGMVIGGGPYFGVGFDAATAGATRLTPFRIVAGHFAAGPGQVVIDSGSAAKLHVSLGDRVRVEAHGPVRSFAVSGIATFGGVGSIGTATFTVFDLATAQRLFARADRFDSILVAGRPGGSSAGVRSAVARVLPSGARVQTAPQQDRFALASLKRFVSILKLVLLAFGAVAIFVGGFTIANTLTITVAHRSRELALLRTLGASRRQVLRTVASEALLVGAAASTVGLFAGLGLAHGLSSLMRAMGLALPQAGMALTGATALVSLFSGLAVTGLAGLSPARRAARVPPVVAMRDDGGPEPAGDRTPIPRTAKVTGPLAFILLIGGMFAGGLSTAARMTLIAPGCLLLFVAVALSTPQVAAPVASVLGLPAARIGGAAGRLARGNAMRNPRRTSAAASALMIGVALVALMTVVAAGMRQSATGSIRAHIRADFVIASSDGTSPIPASVAAAMARIPGAATSAVAESVAQINGQKVTVNGVDPATFAANYRFDFRSGTEATLANLGPDDAIVDAGLAARHHLVVGTRLIALAPTGTRLALTVRGIETPLRLNALGLGRLTIARQRFAVTFPGAPDRLVFLRVPRGGSVPRDIDAALAGYPGVKRSTPAGFADDQAKWLSSVLAVFYVLLALAILVSLLGIVNTLMLSTFERTVELGMLRALGMSRRQMRRMVRQESVITALLGAAQGIAVGILLAALVTTALRSDGLQFVLPIGSLATFLGIAVLAGVAAAVLPARRASRLEPLAALSRLG